MKFYFLPLLSLSLFLSSRSAEAAPPQKIHTYLAAGTNYSLPGSIRVGWKNWEWGLVSGVTLGGLRRSFLRRHSYTIFGPVLSVTLSGLQLGVAGGMGIDTLLFWRIGFRGEVLGIVGHLGEIEGRGHVGVSVAF